MQVFYERCRGLDLHKRPVVACVFTPEGKETRTFGTMAGDLLKLADWLIGGVTHVAIQSTGVYWQQVYNLPEGLGLEPLVVNAQHIKAVPGRKTYVKDSEWIAALLRHGLVRGSYIPGRPQRELRELVRYRTSLVCQRSQVVNRIQKLLEGANIKLNSVATNVVGVSGHAMLVAIITRVEDPGSWRSWPRASSERSDQPWRRPLGACGELPAPAAPQPPTSSGLSGRRDRQDEEGGVQATAPF